eukprot:Nitzschia sp. Nitz4//scaffold97_size77645//54005//55993//NITZ4_005524-RA/size77645-processed-gene-0.86-mRNA-1//1//CDS//3329560674//2627//frame0
MVHSMQTFSLIPNHVQQERLRRQRGLRASSSSSSNNSSARRRAEAQQVGALYQGYGTHYADLWCGSPPQRQTVIVDTGSGITAFPCIECQKCGVPDYHIDRLFDETASSSFAKSTCDDGVCTSQRAQCRGDICKVQMGYAEGSRWEAYEATDSCYLGGPHELALMQDEGNEDIDPMHAKSNAFDLIFGCQTLVTKLFVTQLADGIMGMDNRPEAFWNQMYEAGKMDEKKFSLCFSRSPTAERQGTEAGAITLGGVDERLDHTPMVYTPKASAGRSGFYSVRLRKMWLRKGEAGESVVTQMEHDGQGAKEVPVTSAILNTGGVIVDSGTTDTYWNNGVATAFKKLFKEMTGRDYSNIAVTLTAEELAALPTIIFQMEAEESSNPDVDPYTTPGLAGHLDNTHPHDVLLAFPPSHYMEYNPEDGKYTPRFYVTERSGSVLGANAMMGHNVLFDGEEARLGWAESDCDYTKLIQDNGYEFEITGELNEASPVASPVAEDEQGDDAEANEKEENDDGEVDAHDDEGGEDAPSPSETKPSPSEDTEPTAANDDHKTDELEDLSCTSLSCRGVVLAASVAIVALCLCISSSLFCKGQKSSTHSPLPTSELEMGKSGGASYSDAPRGSIGRGDTEVSSTGFRDDPDDDEEDDNDDGARPAKPAFQGDFY